MACAASLQSSTGLQSTDLNLMLLLSAMPSSFINEHFFNPGNVGDVPGAEALARAGSLTCGSALRLSLRIDELQKIRDAKFKSAGCSYLVAASSFLTEQVKGKSTGEAATLGQSPEKSLIGGLGEWPRDRAHCAALACEALVSAIKSYSDAVRDEWSGDEALICTCFGVSENTIEQEIKNGSLRTIAEVTKACNAGAGCRSCYSLIEDILETVNSEWRIINSRCDDC